MGKRNFNGEGGIYYSEKLGRYTLWGSSSPQTFPYALKEAAYFWANWKR